MFLYEKSHKEPIFPKGADFALDSLILNSTRKFWFLFPLDFGLENSLMQVSLALTSCLGLYRYCCRV